MLMSYCEGDWAMRMQEREDISRREPVADRNDGKTDARPASGESEGNAERVRALQELARKLDKRLLSWVQAKRRP